MSKIFKISGNYEYDGVWAMSSEAFSGEIVVEDNGNFRGYCLELVDTDTMHCISKDPELNRTRYLIGAAQVRQEKVTDILFFKLSNDKYQPPLLYEYHDQPGSECHWSISGIFDNFVPKGKVVVSLSPLPFTDKDARRIKKCFAKVNRANNDNDQQIKRAKTWTSRTAKSLR